MKNDIKIKRVPGNTTLCKVTLQFQFDSADPEALTKFGRVMREIIPEWDRAQFLADFQRAGAEAGLTV